MRALRCVVPLMIAAGLAGCGSEPDPAMPDVAGKKLDVAQRDIKGAGFEDKVDVEGGGIFGVIDESNWEVCEQTPAPGQPLTKAPRLTIERDCNKDEGTPSAGPSPEETASLTPTPSPSAAPPAKAATRITVDALLDKLNAPKANGVKVGDRWLVTGELFNPEYWGTGATGEYFVYLKAQGGKQDLMFFVDESLTRGWGEGTRVELVVQNEERTINDETSDGWLNAISVKTLR